MQEENKIVKSTPYLSCTERGKNKHITKSQHTIYQVIHTITIYQVTNLKDREYKGKVNIL